MSARQGDVKEPSTHIDRALGELLVRRARLTGEDAALVDAAVRELSEARSSGHSALRLDAHPDGASWHDALVRAGVAGPHEAKLPLVLHDGLLQFRRYVDVERRIAARIRERIAMSTPRLRIITGGPGSGKTTRVATDIISRVTREPTLRIALAAPTGKAAARLTESIRAQLESASAGQQRASIPTDARTVHRLLGYRHSEDVFSRNAERPLDADLVIIDEASMLDALLMDALLAALRDETELVLVGDHHQLASVETGDILGSLVQHPALTAAVQTLQGNHRFESQPGIASVALSIRTGRIDEAVELLKAGEHPDAQSLTEAENERALLAPIAVHLIACLEAETPEALLAALGRVRILCAERRGRLAVDGMNQMVERLLVRHGLQVRDRWYHRRPVLVGANDYGTGVFNGDLGVCWREGSETIVHFSSDEGGSRRIAPERLPDVTTAWAMTVHKAQGSEFDNVLFVLPRRESRVLSRELIYTGITRAKKRVTVVGATEILREGLDRTASRNSGLSLALGL